MKLDNNLKAPLYAKGEEWMVERSKDHMSDYTSEHKRTCNAAGTHPDIASLVDPLFAFGVKRVVKLRNQRPSLSLAKERVVQRSVDRVSRRRGDITANTYDLLTHPFFATRKEGKLFIF